MFMAAAVLAVSAQEASPLDTVAMNNTTENLTANATANATINETVNATAPAAEIEAALAASPAASEPAPAQQEAVPEESAAAPQNATTPESVAALEDVTAAQTQNEPAVAAVGQQQPSAVQSVSASSESGTMQIGSAQRSVYNIGGTQTTPSAFTATSNNLPQNAYQVGLPAESIQDLTNMPFFITKFWY
jgi:hypothetical protein